MNRVSHAARLERLQRQLRDEPVVKITWAHWVLEILEQHRRALSTDPAAREPRRVEEQDRIRAQDAAPPAPPAAEAHRP
jgi:hypothetical protein